MKFHYVRLLGFYLFLCSAFFAFAETDFEGFRYNNEAVSLQPMAESESSGEYKEFSKFQRRTAAVVNPLLGVGSFIMGDTKGGLIVVAGEAVAITCFAVGFRTVDHADSVKKYDALSGTEITETVNYSTFTEAFTPLIVSGCVVGLGTWIFSYYRPLKVRIPVKKTSSVASNNQGGVLEFTVVPTVSSLAPICPSVSYRVSF